MIKRLVTSLSIILSLNLALATPGFAAGRAATAKEYNELYDQTGTLRPQYQPLQDYIQGETKSQRKAFIKSSLKKFADDNPLFPVPRILTSDEYATLKSGVEQRAQALRAFLQDHFSGRKTYLKAGVIPKDVIRRIIGRNGDGAFEGMVPPEIVAFIYGPDIIRDADGTFMVVEDNPGFVGGIGDLKLAYDLILKFHPGLKNDLEPLNPMAFYQALGDSFKRQAALKRGKAVFLLNGPYGDHEGNRLKKIFGDMGIETMSPRSGKRFRFTDNGVYSIENNTGRREKIGFVAFSDEHMNLDPTYELNRTKYYLDWANDYLGRRKRDEAVAEKLTNIISDVNLRSQSFNLKKLEKELDKVYDIKNVEQYASGLTEAILTQKVGASYSPGLDFIGDKEFYIYVEDLIRFYLKQEPILKNIPTRRFVDSKTQELDEVTLERTFKEQATTVIKRVDGRGGDGVWVGPKISKSEFKAVKAEIIAMPGSYIAQRFIPLSTLDDHIVDLRLITYVSASGIEVAVPWGRIVSKKGNGKVNISDNGMELATLVASCESRLAE